MVTDIEVVDEGGDVRGRELLVEVILQCEV